MKFRESETVELKKSTAELKEAVISISAILNKHSQGEVYFGIKDDGTVVGQMVGKDTIKDVTQTITDNLDPKIFPKIEYRKIEDKDCLVVEFHGINQPYFAYGRAYMRVGESDKHLTAREIEQQIVKKKRLSWDSEISDKILKDVSTTTVKEYMRKANAARRINFKYTDVKTTLGKLGLLDGGKLTNAAEVLFCNRYLLEFQAAVFAGTDKLTFLDIRSFKGNIFSLREQAEAYVKEHIKWRAEITSGPRKEIPEIPVDAIREAVGNSLCHRDFSNPKGNEVAIFKDRVDIYNPGTFPEELSPNDFIKGKGYSILRNPLIAETMFKSEDIEKWASGLKRIYEECKAAGVKVEFKQVKTGFVVSFIRPRWEEGEGLGNTGSRGGEEKIKADRGDTAEKVRSKYGETAEKIFLSITGNLFIKTHEIAEQTKLSQRTVENVIFRLKRGRFLKRVGPDKGGHWEVLKI